jgi:NMD protein affecting ribosome stability and mRNA decay
MSDRVCATCGHPNEQARSRFCRNCDEVEKRLARYLRSERGRRFVKEALAKAEEGRFYGRNQDATGE